MLGESNQNCISKRDAQKMIHRIESELEKNWFIDLAQKVKNRSARILEVWTWYGTFLHTIKEMWFQNIRGLDMNPAHYSTYPELDSIIDIQTLGMLRSTPMPFDIVVSHLIFDEWLYRDQQNQEFREYMLRGIYSQLKNNWVYYASERFDKSKIREAIEIISPTQDTLLWIYRSDCIAWNKK